MMPRKLVAALSLLLLLNGMASSGSAQAPRCTKPFDTVFREVSPAVVLVAALSVSPFRLRDRVNVEVGSGFFIDPKGLVLTNAHVVYGAADVSVMTSDGKKIPARVLGADPILDLAVLQVAARVKTFPVVEFADSEAVAVGTEVIAIGSPFGFEHTASQGIVSGLNRVLPESAMVWLMRLIQTDAAINPGNSGGPLVDRCARVLGVNTMYLKGAENIGFAVPISIAEQVIPQLVRKGRVLRPWFGIHGKLIDEGLRRFLRIPLVDGFLIEAIEPGSPAERIGLRSGTFPVRLGFNDFVFGGDIITKVNGEALQKVETLMRLIQSLEIGDKVRLEYFRDGALHGAEVVLPERPTLPGDLQLFNR